MEDGRGWCCGVSAEVKQRQKGRAWWDGVVSVLYMLLHGTHGVEASTQITHWDPYNPTNPDRPM